MGPINTRPTRRRVVEGLGAGALAGGAALETAGAQARRRPNILFVMADDLGYADLSCYGRRDYQTPVLDRLARQGARLTQGYANSAVCSPTRAALITGRYHHRLPAGLQEPIAGAEAEAGLPPSHPTLPSLLKRVGYRTALIGKWHLGFAPNYGPLKSGYDYFYGVYPGAADYFHRPTAAAAPGQRPGVPLYENDTAIQPPGYLTDLLADAAIREIAQATRERPFLVSLHFTAPHWPWEGPDDEAASRSITALRHPDGGNARVYGAMVRSMDAAIGRVLQAIERRGATRDTIVVFTSDNGGERFSDTWPFTGMKGELLEGGIRVPLLVRWPGRVPAGSAPEQVMISMDFLPTLLAAAGAAHDRETPPDGEDLLPVLTGAAPARPRKLFWRFKASEQAAVRDGDWKYLKLGGREHLFNLAEDPRERAQLKDRHPEIFDRLKADYAAWDATMLPYPQGSFSESLKGRVPDRY